MFIDTLVNDEQKISTSLSNRRPHCTSQMLLIVISYSEFCKCQIRNTWQTISSVTLTLASFSFVQGDINNILPIVGCSNAAFIQVTFPEWVSLLLGWALLYLEGSFFGVSAVWECISPMNIAGIELVEESVSTSHHSIVKQYIFKISPTILSIFPALAFFNTLPFIIPAVNIYISCSYTTLDSIQTSQILPPTFPQFIFIQNNFFTFIFNSLYLYRSSLFISYCCFLRMVLINTVCSLLVISLLVVYIVFFAELLCIDLSADKCIIHT